MSYEQVVTDLLNADTALLSILTGKVHTFSAAGRNGLNRLAIPGAFDPNLGFLKPACVVAQMDEMDGNAIHVPVAGYTYTITPVITRIYDNGDNGYATIETAYQRIYQLLAYQQINGSFQVLWKHTTKDRREDALKNAAYYDVFWNVHGSRSFS